jgi:Ni,Fe-hydrogenase III large subunit/Ni,Fe-hydrogenase III component G
VAPGLFPFALTPLAGAAPIWHAEVSEAQWLQAAGTVVDSGGRLISLWGSDRRPLGDGFAVHAAYAVPDGMLWVSLRLATAAATYPEIAAMHPAAARMQRAIHDLLGLRAAGAVDLRPWLRHGHWPDDFFPLRHDADASARVPDPGGHDYPFVRVEGDGVHEIAVGPVHAGIIEPGHFRLSVVGEKVLRLEEWLGYVHKGIDRQFENTAPAAGHRLAGRVCGDSTVAYALAYCHALEAAAATAVPTRAQWLRALALERERVANHLGDLGALGNDGGFAFGLAQFSRLKEDWLRLSGSVFGHRFLMDFVCPGGVARDIDTGAADAMRNQCAAIAGEVRRLRAIYDEHAGLQDRFITTGRITAQLAAQLGLTGLAARASGHAIDLRCDHPGVPYDSLAVRMATHHNGDVAARVSVRFDEVLESLRLIPLLCEQLRVGPIAADVRLPAASARGAGWVEGWRGEVLVALELAGDGRIRRCHCHDPSWQNWPLLEHAVIGNIVPDFPLINKSFNLAYAGHDL